MSRIAVPFAVLFLLAVAAGASAADVDERMRDVAAIRGLEFRHPVTAVTIDRSELPERIREQVERDLPYSVDEFIEILQALLLIEPASGDSFDKLLDLYEQQVLAYYDPQTRTYYALRDPPPAMKDLAGAIAEEGVVVHELMHALQDQHFDIGAREKSLRRDTDGGMAYHAVLEGEATLVMLAHLLEKGGADFDTLIRNEMFDGLLTSTAAADMMIGADTPRYFAESMKFPYLQGLRFVVEAYRRGGWDALDRVHADPPRSTREILHPADYFDRKFRARAFSPQPSVPGRTQTVEHLGEFHWSFLLGAENARGWIDDHVTIAQDAECRPTVLIRTSWESEQAAERFLSAYTRLLDGRGIGFLSRSDGKSVLLAYGADRRVMETFLR